MKKALRVIFLIGIFIFIFYMSSQEALKSNSYNMELIKLLKLKWGIDLYSLFGYKYVDIIIRKLGHFFEFAMLSLSFYLVFSAFKFRRATILTIVFCILFAFADEFHQLFVQGRTASFIDVIIDFLGVMTVTSAISLGRVIKLELFNRENNCAVKNGRELL